MNGSTAEYDVAIIGAGAMGAAAAWHLSKTGEKILVIDRFEPPHNMGSSHGESRIIREAYFESPMYVKLVQQAYAWWDVLEKESGKKLFLRTGGLMLGSKERRVFRGASNSATPVTDKARYSASKVIVSAGAWIAGLFPELDLPLRVNRQVLFWFRCKGPAAGNFPPDNFPIYIWEYEENKIFYGFPDLGRGLKIAVHHQGLLTTAGAINREVSSKEINELAVILHRFFDGDFEFDHAAVCMYTNTEDENFIIDYHPSSRNIIIVSACSGHGFKFSSAIGKILSEMVTGQPLSFDISVFNLKRLVN